MHTYPFHGGDYLKDTAHWSEHEKLVQVKEGLLYDLAYRRLLDFYYGEEAPIPNKSHWVATQIRMLAHVEIVGRVLKEKFTLIDGSWHQKRADEEIAKYQKRVDANRKNGMQGGRKPSGEATANPLGSKPRTRTNNHRNTPLPPEGEVAFGLFWDKYPRKVGKPKALIAYAAALKRGTTGDAIMTGLLLHVTCQQWQDLTKVPHPTTWLNRDGWNDQVVSGPQPGAGMQANWWDGKQGLLDKGMELGIPAPADEHPNSWATFKASVWVKAGDGPWWDHTSVAYPIAVKLRDGGSDVASLITPIRRVA